VSAAMRANPSRDTGPERRVRSLLHRAGLRFRKGKKVSAGSIQVRPDIVFGRSRVAVFIDGCFWHQCPEHGRMPASNRDYWVPKFERNQRRDREVDAALKAEGWTVMRFWEHEDAQAVADAVAAIVAASESRLADRRIS